MQISHLIPRPDSQKARIHHNCLALLTLTLLSLVLANDGFAKDYPKIDLANGMHNSIDISDVSRENNILTIKQVVIDGSGWLVLHPFEQGKPNGDKYVGYAYLQDGENNNVEIEVYKGIEPGDKYIIMLHKDVNDNQVLDFQALYKEKL